jgi:3-dehydroquinate dehydratase/shikimate dehydrogenase
MSSSPYICVTTQHSSVHELLEDAEFKALANRPGFLVELRLDAYNDLNEAALHRALNVFAPNALVTFRHPKEGGLRSDAIDSKRLRYLQLAADRGVKYVDIEARTPRAGFNKRDSKLILSYHDFEQPLTNDILRGIWLKHSSQQDVDVVKVACACKTVKDSAPMLRLLRELQTMPRASVMVRVSGASVHVPEPLFVSMGEAGLWTRILAGRFGAPLTYARPEHGLGSAPGQITWRALEEIYRFREIAPGWPVYGVIGNPIAHSLSPLLHNTALKELKAEGVYVPFLVDGDPGAFMHSFGSTLSGVSVTIPHKQAMLKECDQVEPSARAIGAVNTLSRMDGGNTQQSTVSGWLGSNTDAPAVGDALEAALRTLKGKHVLILGAGGAARAVAFGVKERGAIVLILNRTRERADALAKDVGATVVALTDLPKLKLDAIVNATPVGMAPQVDATPLREAQIPPGVLVFDTVYNPLRTKLLELAQAKGNPTVEGLSMFIGQGVQQFELWTGKKAPVEAIEEVVLQELKKTRMAHA